MSFSYANMLLRHFKPIYTKIVNNWWIINDIYMNDAQFLSFIYRRGFLPSMTTIDKLKELAYKSNYYNFYDYWIINKFNLVDDIKNLIKKQLIYILTTL